MDENAISRMIVEGRATHADNPIFKFQALTYLRLTGLKLALLINFNKKLVKDGIYRVVNKTNYLCVTLRTLRPCVLALCIMFLRNISYKEVAGHATRFFWIKSARI